MTPEDRAKYIEGARIAPLGSLLDALIGNARRDDPHAVERIWLTREEITRRVRPTARGHQGNVPDSTD